MTELPPKDSRPGTSTPLRVLYSFPSKLGGGRVGATSWHQVNGLSEIGVNVRLHAGVVQDPVDSAVTVRRTLSIGKLRVSYRLLGTITAYALHDTIVASNLASVAEHIDLIHAWPLASRRTLLRAAQLGIPTVYERPNAHTGYFYDVVERECETLGLTLPATHEHARNEQVLSIEEREYELATRILCPSPHVVDTFVQRGYSSNRLVRHQYGYDPRIFYPSRKPSAPTTGLNALFVGGLSPVKGLHYALKAWTRSSAAFTGTFSIAGVATPNYLALLAPLLRHRSITLLGQRTDTPELMRNSDILILPSLSEGYPLVCAEAVGSGCVPLVSDRVTGLCRHMTNSLVHPATDIDVLAEHISMVDRDRALLRYLREGCADTATEATWSKAASSLLSAYHAALSLPAPC